MKGTAELPYKILVGLEVHVQLKTRTKLFSRSSTAFGAAPNTQTSPVDIGLPGSLPVMNRHAYELALRTAAALNCEIPAYTKWDRKQYFYPDLPKGYQISQYDLPMSREGWLEISDPKGAFEPKRVRIIRAHLEEDAGKSMHDEAAGKADSRIDLNRAGTPLLEIVTYPDLSSPQEAKAFLTELKLLLSYLDVSDCNMEEGSLRVDANVNLHVPTAAGEIATPLVEVKNMNSFRSVERALAYEAQRQYEVWRETGKTKADVPKQTRGWDDQAQVTRGQRHKEESSDYRYFPDPDLCPVIATTEQVEEVRRNLGELPAALRSRLEAEYAVTRYDADVMVNQGRPLAAYFEELARGCGDGKQAGNWIQQDVLRTLKETGAAIEAFPIPAARLAELLKAVQQGQLDNARARIVFGEMLTGGLSTGEAMQKLGIEKVESTELEELCRELLDQNPRIVADVKGGKEKAVGALIGQARKKNPNVNPNDVRAKCLELIAAE
ncbi:MAG: Asp-tRNA(Asn)/Glu-tRNA(Gln) amidotransferase subunit GatB [Planctomycetes bacterium]|nr:Asp-tRNA(Asn)/Glu-tRNA(Gln) amidotransferase subunit GatB [Planctomycetota bacterium]